MSVLPNRKLERPYSRHRRGAELTENMGSQRSNLWAYSACGAFAAFLAVFSLIPAGNHSPLPGAPPAALQSVSSAANGNIQSAGKIPAIQPAERLSYRARRQADQVIHERDARNLLAFEDARYEDQAAGQEAQLFNARINDRFPPRRVAAACVHCPRIGWGSEQPAR